MKKQIFLLVFAISLGTFNAAAATFEEIIPKPNKAIVTQVYKLLLESTIPDEIRGTKAEIRVAVDNGNYLRILSIETESDLLEKYIRKHIDFQKLTRGIYEQGIVYRIPLEVRK